MPQLNFRVTSGSDTSQGVLNAMRAIEGVQHAGEVDRVGDIDTDFTYLP